MRGSAFQMAQDDGCIETDDRLILKKQASVVGLGKVTSMAEDRAELEPGTAALRVRRADHSATLPQVSLRASKLSIWSRKRS